MGKATILTGARAKITIAGHPVGLFSQCSWSIKQNKEPAFILGRFHPAEITPTTQEPVTISLSGYRVVDNGPYKAASATLLQNLLNEEDFTVIVTDRQSKKTIFSASGCRVQGWSSGVAARGVSDIRIDIIAMIAEDEFGIKAGGDGEPDASSLSDS